MAQHSKDSPKKYKVFLVGGGSLGPVNPLLGIAHDLEQSGNFEFVWISTRHGPENLLITGKKYYLPAAKLRRYISHHTLFMPFVLSYAILKALFITLKERPDLVLSAGSYLGVPMILAGKIFGARCIVHQQDIEPSLSNRLAAPWADIVTVNFADSLRDYKKTKALCIGNPVRTYLFDSTLHESPDPTILILGGGQGSQYLNTLTRQLLDELTSVARIIHVTGRGKGFSAPHNNRYEQYELLGDEIGAAIQRATIVITRAGLSTLTELAYAKKCAIVLPIHGSHQEHNADFLARHDAVVTFRQPGHDADMRHSTEIAKAVKTLLANPAWRATLGENLSKLFNPRANQAMIRVITKLLSHG